MICPSVGEIEGLNWPPFKAFAFSFKLQSIEFLYFTAHKQTLTKLTRKSDIFEAGGLEVIFTMFKNDHMQIIKQKCLDALTNILCVPIIEEFVLNVRKLIFLS